MCDMQEDEKFVHFIVKSIVRNPDEVVIERTVDDQGVFITIKCAQSDNGIVIGKGGANINALRILLKTIAAKHNNKVAVKVLV